MGKDQAKESLFSLGSVLLPQEETLELESKRKEISIGIPKENHDVENRICVTPEGVQRLNQLGFRVVLETDAGEGANYSDHYYSEKGGEIAANKTEVFQCDVILKVAPLTIAEVKKLKGNQLVISSLHFNKNTKEMVELMMKKKITALSFENIKDKYDVFPVVNSMDAIAGSTSIMIAGEYLSKSREGKGVLLGGVTGITPTEVVIIGAGKAAEYATRAALGFGANIKLFDSSLEELTNVQDKIGRPLYTSTYHPKVVESALRSADVVIGTLKYPERSPKYWITEEMVKKMKKGSVIIDLGVDVESCIETSECKTQSDPTYIKHGVIHYSVPNLPSVVARTASIALSNVTLSLLSNLMNCGSISNLIREDMGIRHGIYLYNGLLTNQMIGRYYNLPSKDIDLLMAAF